MESKVSSLMSLIVSGTISATLGYQTMIIDEISQNPKILTENEISLKQEPYLPLHIKDSLVFHMHDSTICHDSIILKFLIKEKDSLVIDTITPIDSTRVVFDYTKNHHWFNIGIKPLAPKVDDSLNK